MNEREMAANAKALVAPGKGVLAIDESAGTIKRRFDSINVECSEENRRAYRDILINVQGGGEFVSGMILFDETIRQKALDGTPFTECLKRQGIQIGIKVDTGSKKLAGFPGEEVTEGLDGLRERLAEYRKLGATFAKWRAVINIGADFPSHAGIDSNTHALARYASLCQEAGIVPIVEPEVMMDGDHDIDRCYEITEATLNSLFQALYRQRVPCEQTVLKASMVISGSKCAKQASVQQVAEMTVRCLKQTVPATLPGIVFLSGGQSEVTATAHLDAMNRMGPHPWPLSFSFGRALQAPALKAWGGAAAKADAARKALYHREKMNSLACFGKWTQDAEKAA